MPSDSIERRLAAIMFTDLVGSTAIMARSEEEAIHARRRHRELVRPLIERHGGQLIEAPADETLSLFGSALDAVSCALAIDAATEDEPFKLHVAIHSGDVLVDGNEVQGDGVNIAARLLAFSEGGGICISEEVYQAVRNQPDIEVTRIGERELRNVGRPVGILSLQRPRAGRASADDRPQGYARASRARALRAAALATILAVAGAGGWWLLGAPDAESPAILAGQIRSLAVLPLENLSGDPEQAYFTDGMTEALISNLAKLASFGVVSRTSVLQYAGARKPMAEIARELDVDAIVEGSVLRAGEAVRITVQLIDAHSDRHLWTESYERDLSDVLKLQREVAQAITREIQLQLSADAGKQLGEAETVDPAAYEAYLKGRYFLQRTTRENHATAVKYFEEAVMLDPEFAPAWAGLADGYT